jgi:MFS family permease
LYGWGVLEIGMFYAAAAATGVLGFVFAITLGKCIPDRVIVLIGNFSMLAGFIVLAPAPLQMERFIIGVAIVTFGLPIAQALINSLMTKILRKDQQGLGNGMMTSAAAAARIFTPIWSAYLFDYYGTAPVFGGGIIMLGSAFVLLLLTCKCMVPPQSVS